MCRGTSMARTVRMLLRLGQLTAAQPPRSAAHKAHGTSAVGAERCLGSGQVTGRADCVGSGVLRCLGVFWGFTHPFQNSGVPASARAGRAPASLPGARGRLSAWMTQHANTGTGRRPDFDREADHGLLDPGVRQAWTELILPLVPLPGSEVADLGCGTGSLSLLLAEDGHRVRGLDLSGQMVEAARAKAARAAAAGLPVAAEFRQGDASEPPYPPASCDVVLARHVLWALPDPDAALGQLDEALAGARDVAARGRAVGHWRRHAIGGMPRAGASAPPPRRGRGAGRPGAVGQGNQRRTLPDPEPELTEPSTTRMVTPPPARSLPEWGP